MNSAILPRKVAIYARVSTSSDRLLQDPSLQLQALRTYAKDKGLDVVGEYVDRASGKSVEGRQQFLKMINEADRQLFDSVLVLRLDRFMRDVTEGLTYSKRLRTAGVSLIMVNDPCLGNMDTASPMGQCLFTIVFAIADLERQQIIERTKEGISKFQKEKGYWGAGKNRRKDINTKIAAELLKVKNLTQVAEAMHIPRTTLRAHLMKAGVPLPTSKDRLNSVNE